LSGAIASALLLGYAAPFAQAGEYETGLRPLAAKSYDSARPSFIRAVSRGNGAAAREVGFMLYRGSGVRQDDAEALKWFVNGAELCDLQSQIDLGQMYEYGLSVHQSDFESARWLRAAAEQGDPGSQFRMGGIVFIR
jgi:TPR repeat protein